MDPETLHYGLEVSASAEAKIHTQKNKQQATLKIVL